MSPIPAPDYRSAIPSLTGIRGLAAAWIVCMHFWESFIVLVPGMTMVYWFVGQGNYAVDLFFLLSGFIMMHTYGGRPLGGLPGYGNFVWRRMARLYPAYLAAMAGMVGLVLGASLLGVPKSDEMYPMHSLVFEALMIQAWGPLLPSWNYPAWSVSAEWFAYLFLFPIALWGYRGLAGREKRCLPGFRSPGRQSLSLCF